VLTQLGNEMLQAELARLHELADIGDSFLKEDVGQ